MPGLLDRGPRDIPLYTTGGGALILTQIYGKSYPHLAEHVFSNVIGGGNVNAAKWKFQPKANPLALFFAPAPIGWNPPTNFGLEPNWLRPVNETLTYKLGLPNQIGIPESQLLKTLPDNHPTVFAERWDVVAKEQSKAVQEWARRASLSDISEVYAIASGINSTNFFFKPENVREDLMVSAAARFGERTAYKELRSASYQSVLPAPSLPDVIPSALDGFTPPPSNLPTFADLIEARDADPFNTTSRPSSRQSKAEQVHAANILQQEAEQRAPALLRNLVSEKADP